MRDEAETPENASVSESTVSRRKFFGKLGSAAVGATVLGSVAPLIDNRSRVEAASGAGGNSFYHQRSLASYQFRVNCAKDNFQPLPPRFDRPSNNDEILYPNRI